MTRKDYAITGLLAPVLFWTAYLILSTIREDYSFATKAVSELGAVDAPQPWLWNIFGYIIPGLAVAVFGRGLKQGLSALPHAGFPAICIALSGLLMAWSGIFPGDFDNKTSATMLLHAMGGLGSYLCFLAGAFTYPRYMKRSVHWKGAAAPALTFVCLTIVFGAWPFVFPDAPAVGQRLVFLFYWLWIFFTALKLYSQPVESDSFVTGGHRES